VQIVGKKGIEMHNLGILTGIYAKILHIKILSINFYEKFQKKACKMHIYNV